MTRACMLFAAPLALAVMGAAPAWADCARAPGPVIELDFDSRYSDSSDTRSELDLESAAEAEEALAPIDDFLRDLVEEANSALKAGPEGAGPADCVLSRVSDWARADALSDLGSETANLTIGSRLAGFALVLMQVAPHATNNTDREEVEAWLSRRVAEQMRFWEEDAPPGARQGNLRAWAALAASATSATTGDPVPRAWATWSTSYVLCTADEDGSLPQEMRRGRLALQYQLHATAPLVLTTLLLERQGISLSGSCQGALDRVVGFVLDDVQTGQRTQAITGEVQSFFDGSDTIEEFHLAWLEAYLNLGGAWSDEANALADEHRPLSYSKLGGNQTLLWQRSH